MLRPYRFSPCAGLAEAADTLRGYDNVVEPDAARGRIGDVVLRPEPVQLQRRGVAELPVERATCRGREVALRAVGANRAEVVLDPGPELRTLGGLGECLNKRVVLPDFEHRAGVRAHVGIELGVNLDAGPGVVGRGEGRPADERVPPI